MTERRRWGWWRRPGGKARAPLALVVVVAVVGIVVAVTGAAKPVPGLEFLQSGHWIANPTLGLVVHVDGADRKPDAEVAVPNLEPGSRVVQGETNGYVVGRTGVTEFDKSTLSVEKTAPLPPSGKRPVGVEVAGGPYLVFTDTGQVVRLGVEDAVVSADGPLGPPVTTADGSLWLHRTDNGAVCRLARDSDRLVCPAVAPAGHAGGLTVSGDKPVFVDFTDDTLRTIEANGLGDAVPAGVDVPPTATVAPADVAGKVAVLDQAGDRMFLLDAKLDGNGRLGGQRPPATEVDLPSGEYAGPAVTGDAVVLLDHDRSSVRTYDSEGRERRTTPIPKENGKPELVRGEDSRVYVDGAEGKHVVVVDRDGTVSPVPVVPVKPEDRKEPAPPPSEKPAEQPTAPSTGQPTQRPADTPVGRPEPRQTQPTQPQRRTEPTQQPAPPPPPPPIAATPPGIPGNLNAAIRVGDPDATVTWSAAAANGANVTAYHLAWNSDDGRSGAATVGGGVFSHVIAGIGIRSPFTVTVTAENSAGRGAPATFRKATGDPRPRQIQLSQGDRAPQCSTDNCYWMSIVMTGFEPNTAYTLVPHSTDPNYRNPGHTTRTNEDGYADVSAFYYNGIGDTVWVSTAGVESNRVTWRVK